MNTVKTKREAFEAGVAGQPEPTPVTKHVRYCDPISGLWVEGDVETDASTARRVAWRQGRKQFDVADIRIRNQERN